jgi:hypothetical protein
LRKGTISFVMFVRLYGTTRLSLDWLSWNSIFEDFSKICWENQSFTKIWQNLTNVKGTLQEDQYTSFIISLSFIPRMRNVSDKSCRENQKTHFGFSNFFFFFENRAVYEKMWGNIVKRGMSQVTIWRMGIVCWIGKATNTHTHTHTHTHKLYNTYCFRKQQWLHESVSMLRHTYIASLVKCYHLPWR